MIRTPLSNGQWNALSALTLVTCTLLSTSELAAQDSPKTSIQQIMPGEPLRANSVFDSAAVPAFWCRTICTQLVDYQSANSPLYFSRSYSVPEHQKDMELSRWRHGFETVLTRSGNDRIVVDQFGNLHTFKLLPNGEYLSASGTGGQLRKSSSNHYQWENLDNVRYQFNGSYPTSIRYPDGEILSLHYQQGKLETISDKHGQKITLDNDAGLASRVSLPDGRSLTYSNSLCLPESTTAELESDESDTVESINNADNQCDTQANPVPAFENLPVRSGITYLDARPESCQSYFTEYYGTIRGEEIESGMANLPPYNAMIHTNRSFPIVDFVNGNELIVVRSRDLGNSTFNDPANNNSLFQSLISDGQQIQSQLMDRLAKEGHITMTETGQTTRINYSDKLQVSMQLVIRQNMASPSHWTQIETARNELKDQYGINLQIVIIP